MLYTVYASVAPTPQLLLRPVVRHLHGGAARGGVARAVAAQVAERIDASGVATAAFCAERSGERRRPDREAADVAGASVIGYANLRDRDATIEWLQRCADTLEDGVLGIRQGNEYDFLRDDPRFQATYCRVGFP